MAFPSFDFSPPISDAQGIFDIFNFSIGTMTGFATVTGLLLLVILSFFVWRQRGAKSAMVFSLAGLPILVTMGYLPSWVKLIVYATVSVIGVNWYVRSTEGV